MALPEIRLLQADIGVTRELSFSRAAQSLHLGQSILSKQIYELESQLGSKLLERNQLLETHWQYREHSCAFATVGGVQQANIMWPSHLL